MKQHITKEQWGEIKLADRFKVWGKQYNLGLSLLINKLYPPTIGEMIEFLGDDWYKKIKRYLDIEYPENKYLCDALWEAVKEKLKK